MEEYLYSYPIRMSYDYASSYGKTSTPSGTVAYDPSQYSGVDYAAIQGSYGTPTANSVPEINKEYYGYGATSTYNKMGYTAPTDGYQQVGAKQPTKYGEYKASLKRKFLDLGANRFKKPEEIAEFDDSGKLAIFIGRDKSYPDELNSLIHPATCDLCNMKMNSLASAKDHYESKAHDKNITHWLTKAGFLIALDGRK